MLDNFNTDNLKDKARESGKDYLDDKLGTDNSNNNDENKKEENKKEDK